MQIVEPLCDIYYAVELNKWHSLRSKRRRLTWSDLACWVQALHDRGEKTTLEWISCVNVVLEETMKRPGQDQKENFSSSTEENKYSVGKQSKDQQYLILDKFHDK